MKKAHKLISAVLVSTMVLSMTACGSGEKTYKVGILQQLEHPALDQATQGFQDALTKLMGDPRQCDDRPAGFRGGHQHDPGTRNLRDGLRNRARH